MLPRAAGHSLRLVFQLGLLAAVPAVHAGDSVLLKPRLDQPQSAYIEHINEARQRMPGPDGNPMDLQTRGLFGLISTLSPSQPELKLHTVLDRLVGGMQFGENVKSSYDTDDPDNEEASPDHKAALTPLLSMPIKLTLTPEGIATAVDGGEPIRAKLRSLGDQNFIAKSLAETEMTDRQLMSLIGELPFVLYPHREVKVGEKWQKTHNDEYPQIGKVTLVYDCTLDSIENAGSGELALVSFSGKISKDPNEQPAAGQRLGKIDGTFTGSAKFAVAQGRFVDFTRQMEAKMEVPAWWSPDPNTPLMKIDGTFKDSFVVGPVAERTRQKELIAKRIADAKAAREAEEAAAMAGPVEPVTPANPPVPWTQWGGPNRNFHSDATGLANTWPKSGPPKLWERPLGDGYSAIVCDGKLLFTQYSLRNKDDAFQGDEVIVALSAQTGETVWEHKYPAAWPKDLQMEFGPGPHSTPLIVGDRLFTVGTTAKLYCLDKSTGKPIWSKDLLTDYKAALNMRGYGSSPLAYKDTIVLPVSTEKGRAVMAFSQADGSVVWEGGEFEPGYASLFVINAFDTEQLVAFTGKSLCGLNPTNGSAIWTVDHPTQWGANISTPVWEPKDQHFFISSAYGMGARGIKLEKTSAAITPSEVWSNSKMKIQHGNAVRVGDWVYGSSGDFGPAFLAAVNAKTGEFGWRQRGFAKATVLYADGKIIGLDEDGLLFMAKADPSKYRLLAKAPGVCERTAWTVPTLYGRTLFVRDRFKIMALDLAATEKS